MYIDLEFHAKQLCLKSRLRDSVKKYIFLYLYYVRASASHSNQREGAFAFLNYLLKLFWTLHKCWNNLFKVQMCL